MTPLVALSDSVSYLPATRRPFCCDIGFVKGREFTWIFDVGIGKQAVRAVNAVEGRKNIVLSHFHPDHITNLPFVTYDGLFVSAHTKKYTLRGTVVSGVLDCDGIQIMPMPSSHAKGSLALVAGKYAFLGDGAFCKYQGSRHLYNVQLLGDMLRFLENLDCEYFCLSHERNFAQGRESVLALYREIYSRKKPGEPFISVDDFFPLDLT